MDFVIVTVYLVYLCYLCDLIDVAICVSRDRHGLLLWADLAKVSQLSLLDELCGPHLLSRRVSDSHDDSAIQEVSPKGTSLE
jgi:hypothetical protein